MGIKAEDIYLQVRIAPAVLTALIHIPYSISCALSESASVIGVTTHYHDTQTAYSFLVSAGALGWCAEAQAI